MLCTVVVVITLNVVLSTPCLAEYRKETFKIRAARAARLLFFSFFKGGGGGGGPQTVAMDPLK